MVKRKKQRDCSCSAHPAGRPNVSIGPCYGAMIRPAKRDRIEGHRIERLHMEAEDPDDVED